MIAQIIFIIVAIGIAYTVDWAANDYEEKIGRFEGK